MLHLTRNPAKPLSAIANRRIHIVLTVLALAGASMPGVGCDPQNSTPHANSQTNSAERSESPAMEIQNARVRAVPPGVRVSAAYVIIKNNSDQPDRLVAVHIAGVSGHAEIHETTVDDAGVMRMRELSAGVTIPAKDAVDFTPGGLHIMLMGLRREPQAGQTFELEFEFERAGRHTVAATVVAGD